ncbi:MAG: hypothetical protein KTR30_02550 [Saprospiraceae bacterium]|nr:hypothetical protein [Saprospiraceae bacterium]
MKTGLLKLLLSLFLLLSVQYTFSQAPPPHISGTVQVSMKDGTIKAEIVISKIPALADYAIWLNTGFTLEHLADANKQVSYAPLREYNPEQYEVFQYVLKDNKSNELVFTDKMTLKYTGAFPVLESSKQVDGWCADWKGNIVFIDNTLRASEQTAWYPIIYDKKNDVLLNKVTYDLEIVTEESASIYLNGSSPVKANRHRFTTETPVPLLLVMGSFDFKAQQKINFINTQLPELAEATLIEWTNNITQFYEQKLDLQYSRSVSYVESRPACSNWGWMFVSYPSIMVVGNEANSLSSYFDQETHQFKRSADIAYIAHELAHYYFGEVFVPNAELKWLFLEGLAEYVSLQALRTLVGEKEYQTLIQKYSEEVKGMTFSPLHEITTADQINQTYRYRYIPLLLTALEKEVGSKKLWLWLKRVINSKDSLSNYNFLKETLLAAGISQNTLTGFEATYIAGANSLEQVLKRVEMK